jgi:hypothetical protein
VVPDGELRSGRGLRRLRFFLFVLLLDGVLVLLFVLCNRFHPAMLATASGCTELLPFVA